MILASTKYEIRFMLARRAYFAEVATKAESAPARRHEIRFQETHLAAFFHSLGRIYD